MSNRLNVEICMMIALYILIALVLVFAIFKIRKSKMKSSHLKAYRKETKFKVMPALKKSKKKKVLMFFSFKGDIKASPRGELSKFIDEVICNKQKVL